MALIILSAEVCTKRLRVTFQGEHADDNKFLEDCYKRIFHRRTSLPLHRLRKESCNFISIGRALTHTAALTETLSCCVARSAILSMVFDDVNLDYVLDDFLLYQTLKLRERGLQPFVA